jgi:hypothetical protein
MNDIRSQIHRWQKISLPLVVFGFILLVVSACLWPGRFFPSYLMAFLFWIGLTLGSFPVLMIHYLVGGSWGTPLRRFLEAALSTLPLMTVLLVPLFFGLNYLYAWTRAEEVARSTILQHKEIYLNEPALVVRMIVIFALWLLLAFPLLRWSRRQDSARNLEPTIRLRTLSGPGLVIYTLATTFAYIDWVMALEPDWYSSIFPVIIIVGQTLSALALGILLSISSRRSVPDFVTSEQLNQLGDLLLSFVVLWAYVSFAQLLIIYAGNLPHEIVWYLHRMRGGWLWIGVGLVACQFAAPFVLLLFRQIKRRGRILGWIAGGLFVMQGVCVFWYVAPTFRPAVSVDWLDPVTFVEVGAAWFLVFSRRLLTYPLLPPIQTARVEAL